MPHLNLKSRDLHLRQQPLWQRISLLSMNLISFHFAKGGILVFAILVARERFFFCLGWVGGLIVSLLLTLFNIASAFEIFSLSLSVVASCGGGLLVTSTVMDLCPSRG